MKKLTKLVFRMLGRVNPEIAHSIRTQLRSSVKKRIQGQNNQLRYATSVLREVTFDIVGSGNLIEISEAYLCGVTFHIRGNDHRITIGRACRFNKGGGISFEDHDGRLVIGDGSSFENVHIAVTEPHSSISIGADCMFAYDIDIRTGDSHSVLDSVNGSCLNPAASIKIGNHVWVAAHCILLKGVQIADNSIVATGSVVTKSCDVPGSILAGNPARSVKENITWSRSRVPS